MRSLLPLLFCLGLVAAAAEPAPSAFTSDQLVALLQRDLASHFNLEGDYQLELLRPWTAPVATASSWSVQIEEYPNTPMSTMVLRCRVLADGALVDEPILLFRASLWRDAWFARQPLTVGEIFDPSVLEVRKVDCLRERDVLPISEGNSSCIFARQVQADHVLTWNDIGRRPLVRKGELVDVVASEGMLQVTLKALALENGARGDLVLLRNLESMKNISGQVVAEDRVAVSF